MHARSSFESFDRAPPRAFIGVVSRSHVHRGVAGSFAQVCGGKSAPLRRMRAGDFLIYYSPRTDRDEGAPLRAFTAIGRVEPGDVYRFDMGGGFVPHRRDVAYFGAKEVALASIHDRLHFTQTPWGLAARSGHFEIDAHDLKVIADAMGASLGSSREARGAPEATPVG